MCNPRTVTCEICGRAFETPTNGRFCSSACRRIHRRRQWKARQENRLLEPDGYNRPYTSDTPFLVRKWLAEGDSLSRVADALGRSPENVRGALKLPVTDPKQRAILEELEGEHGKI